MEILAQVNCVFSSCGCCNVFLVASILMMFTEAAYLICKALVCIFSLSPANRVFFYRVHRYFDLSVGREVLK